MLVEECGVFSKRNGWDLRNLRRFGIYQGLGFMPRV